MINTQKTDRYIFSALALYYLVLTSWGFLPSSINAGGEMPVRIIIHGAIFSTWIILLVVQTTLISTSQRKLHAAMGILGALVVLVMIPAGLYPVLYKVSIGTKSIGEGGQTTGILIFSYTFLVIGLFKRNDPFKHKRFIILGTMPLMGAAIVRIMQYQVDIPTVMTLTFIPAITLLSYDYFTRRKIYRMHLSAIVIVLTILFSPLFWESTPGRLIATSLIPVESKYPESITIVGSAVQSTSQGTIQLTKKKGSEDIWQGNVSLNNGVIEFRANNDWIYDWGGQQFESGQLISHGPAIVAKEGQYFVTVDLSTKHYRFEKILGFFSK